MKRFCLLHHFNVVLHVFVCLGKDIRIHWLHFGWETSIQNKSQKGNSLIYFQSKKFYALFTRRNINVKNMASADPFKHQSYRDPHTCRPSKMMRVFAGLTLTDGPMHNFHFTIFLCAFGNNAINNMRSSLAMLEYYIMSLFV